MRKTALITGINGMDGSHLADLLLTKGYTVYGLERRTSSPNRTNTKHLVGQVDFITGDVTDKVSLIRAMEIANPDEVYNLAAQSFVGASWVMPNYTSEVNAIGVLNVLEAIREVNKNIRMYQASSSEMFGNAVGHLNEKTKFAPRSPYGVSKVYGHHIAINYRESYDMFVSCGILFNHESERRGIEFVTRKISDGVAKIATGNGVKIMLGNIHAKRDWGYSPDYVEAMWRMLDAWQPDDYVVATGENHSVKDFLDEAFLCIGVKDWSKYVELDKSLFRPAEIDYLCGDYTKAHSMLGWEPTTKFKDLVRIMVESDIERHKG